MPDWLIPVLTFISGICGGFIGARVSIVRLETQMATVLEWKGKMARLTHNLNEDVLVHDLEIEQLSRKVNVERIRRQAVRRERGGDA
jgi:hypothetical protein